MGDAAGAILSGWILLEAAGQGLPRATLLRMTINIGIDSLVGAVPFLGDAFDFVWKANQRNLALLERHLADPARAGKMDRLFMTLLAVAVVVMCGIITVEGVILVTALFRMVTPS